MQVHKPDDRLVEAFLLASRALVGIAARSLADLDDVTLPQFRALVVVSTRPGITVSDLAAALDIHGSTATRLCDRLVRKRLLRRVAGTSDRRSTRLFVAAAGTRLVQRVSDRRRRDLATIVSELEPQMRQSALDAVTAFAVAAGEAGDTDLFGWDVALPRARGATAFAPSESRPSSPRP